MCDYDPVNLQCLQPDCHLQLSVSTLEQNGIVCVTMTLLSLAIVCLHVGAGWYCMCDYDPVNLQCLQPVLSLAIACLHVGAGWYCLCDYDPVNLQCLQPVLLLAVACLHVGAGWHCMCDYDPVNLQCMQPHVTM